MLWTLRARLLALAGRAAEARDDVARADTYFEDRDPPADPPWLCYYDEAEHQGSTGKALMPVAQYMGKPELVAPRLEAVIRLQGSNYPVANVFADEVGGVDDGGRRPA
jgi:hypothetical protein